MVTIDDVRAFAMTLPRTTEALVRDRVKFRVGRIVFVAFSRDETEMGFGFPKEEREALVRSEPDTFMMPGRATSVPVGGVPARGARRDRDARARPGRLADVRAEEGGGRVRRRARLRPRRVGVPARWGRCRSDGPTLTRRTLLVAVRELAETDPALAASVERFGPPRCGRESPRSPRSSS